MEGTVINGKEVWVHGNATEHMGDFVKSAKGSVLVENELMLSFQDSVKQILPNVNAGRNFFPYVNGWEIGINGDTSVIYHALYRQDFRASLKFYYKFQRLRVFFIMVVNSHFYW